MKKFLVLLLTLFVSLSSVALANEPIKIARVPIVIQNIKLDKDTANALEVKMARATIIPGNNVLKVAEFIPPLNVGKALDEIWNDMYRTNKKAKMTDAVLILAEDIDADLVICPIIRRYSQNTSITNKKFETRLKSSVEFELIIYDKTTGKILDKRASRSWNEAYNKYGTAAYLAGECLDQLITDTKLRELMISKRG